MNKKLLISIIALFNCIALQALRINKIINDSTGHVLIYKIRSNEWFPLHEETELLLEIPAQGSVENLSIPPEDKLRLFIRRPFVPLIQDITTDLDSVVITPNSLSINRLFGENKF